MIGDWIINFPTKRDWREPSRYEDVADGLDALYEYLRDVGPASVSLPALGCGHGGLDWARVSQMISEKLQALPAHIYVYEPAASRRAGDMAKGEVNLEDTQLLAKLGFERLSFTSTEGSGPTYTYVKGRADLVDSDWVAILPSRDIDEREQAALMAIARGLGRSPEPVTVSLIYVSRATETIAEKFLFEGVNVVLILPFGVLTRMNLARELDMKRGNLTLISTTAPGARWSKQLVAQAAKYLYQHSSTILVSDPHPSFLGKRGANGWADRPLYYVLYGSHSDELRRALREAGARPLGRRPDTGEPNTDVLLPRPHQIEKSAASSKSHSVRQFEFAIPLCSPDDLRHLIAIIGSSKLLDAVVSVTLADVPGTDDLRSELERLQAEVSKHIDARS